jgi:hypothetical protein
MQLLELLLQAKVLLPQVDELVLEDGELLFSQHPEILIMTIRTDQFQRFLWISGLTEAS